MDKSKSKKSKLNIKGRKGIHDKDEATGDAVPQSNVGTKERVSYYQPMQCYRCQQKLDPIVETSTIQVDDQSQYIQCFHCEAKNRFYPVGTHVGTNDDQAEVPRQSTPSADESRSTIVGSQNENLTDEDHGNENRISEERDTIPSQPILSPQTAQDPRSNDRSTFTVYLGVTVLIALTAIGTWYAFQFWSQSKVTPLKPASCENFLQLHSKYPNMDDILWFTLIVGVDKAIYRNPGEPSTFIFLYNSSSVGQSLLDDVTRIAIECFGSGGAIWRTSNDFKSAEIAQDYGTVLDRHREELKSQGVLVVRDLDRVPPTAAKIFFTICDSYEPLVHKAIIFFTIDMSRQPTQVVKPDRSATSIAEDILKDLWRAELDPNMLDPLVVRLTENVFRID